MNICCVKKCKNKNVGLIKNNYFCKNHSIFFFNKTIIKIQKIYRGHFIRKKVKNIFLKLPDDIQKKILFFVNESIYVKRYYKKIRNIINKKTYNVVIYFKFKITISIFLIKHVYYLNNKYRAILFLNDIKCLYVFGEELLYSLNNFIVNQFIDNDEFILQSMNVNIDLTNATIKDIMETICIIYNYRLNYNKEFNIIKNQ